MKNGPQAARAELERLKVEVGARRMEERALGRAHDDALRAVLEAREVLTQAFTDGGDAEAATKQLHVAEAEAAKPWPELRRAASVKVDRAQAAVGRFASEHRRALWAELAPRAIAAAAKVDETFTAALTAVKEVDALERPEHPNSPLRPRADIPVPGDVGSRHPRGRSHCFVDYWQDNGRVGGDPGCESLTDTPTRPIRSALTPKAPTSPPTSAVSRRPTTQKPARRSARTAGTTTTTVRRTPMTQAGRAPQTTTRSI